MTDAQSLFSHYRQVKNPNPAFTPREGKKTLPFCRKLMAKAEGFTSRFDFAIHVAIAYSQGKRRRMPPVLRCRAIDALLQGMCFHYDPVTNSVQCSVTDLAIECGLATKSANGISDIRPDLAADSCPRRFGNTRSTSRRTAAAPIVQTVKIVTTSSVLSPQTGAKTHHPAPPHH